MSWINSSATSSYFAICERAVSELAIMNCFKSMPNWFRPVGYADGRYAIHIDKELGTGSFVQSFTESFKRHDTVGKPLFSHKSVSSEVWRSMDTIHHLSQSFGNLSGSHIVEFGGNLGILASNILTVWPEIGSYTIIDFPPVCSMSMAYLKQLNFTHSAISYNQSASGSTDLFISEYALTENTSGSLYNFYDQYVKNADKVFIRSNFWNGSDASEFINRLSDDFTIQKYQVENDRRKKNKILIAVKKENNETIKITS